MIYYLIYLSAATHLFSEQELADILTVSRTNNSKLNVTGILLYSKGNILQVLEGDKQVINDLYDKIANDGRHINVIRLATSEFPERSFAEWTMGFDSISPADWNMYEGYFSLQPDKLYDVVIAKNKRIGTSLNNFININLNAK